MKAWAGSPGIRLLCWEEQVEVYVSSQVDMLSLRVNGTASAKEMSKSTVPFANTPK